MHYKIVHKTAYTYSESVRLSPHILKLRSRSNAEQTLHRFQLDIDPSPLGRSSCLDLDGNSLEKIWFGDRKLNRLEIITTSEVETHCRNPFNYILEPWAISFPIDYPSSVLARLSPYLNPRYLTSPIDPRVHQLALDIASANHQKITPFLNELNQQIYQNCQYQIRETGDPLPPGITWQHKQGTCRDFAVLFMEACRSLGLAARFVSGYQEGDRDSEETRYLHAWAEVYLPGAGWRGYDPTHGLATSDGHIPIAASALPEQTTPISGHLRNSCVQSEMTFDLAIEVIDSEN